ncbi:F-box domain-containing protein [Mycena sanguinolenta]|uniref:F-box domain-containing protein n=1 Tax=Mycena sanguinolenta TaxID=230812 RepID=A0A8H6YYW5_9AGAR|nr:F-box domain-containing protein [Mycena sanguinolenta]
MDVPELLLQFFESLPLRDLISATHVCQQWRALVPRIDSPTRLRLLGLSFCNVTSPHPISLSVRISYVEKIETKYSVVIPEPYRTILTEWPSSQPPPGMHWPHAVRFHASGFCYCARQNNETPDICLCGEKDDVREMALTMFEDVFRLIVKDGVVPVGEHKQCASWELFDKPLRLHTPEQNAQTMRFIKAQPSAAVEWKGKWAYLKFSTLQLSRYHVHTPDEDGISQASDGTFVLILDGPSRGQIHAWSSGGDTWYDGFEAEDFWEWNYSEWDAASTSAFYGIE